MTYQETLEYLFTRLPMYQRDGKAAYKKDLSNTIALLQFLDHPHKKFKSIHIAGTNGKGTCAHGIAAILQLSGYKTGLYTSPHLKNFTERIKINGFEIDPTNVINFVDRIRPVIEEIQPSFFEITVAMAFDYFARQEVDIAVVETGLGGRLDSTNVISPEACLITNIGYDHVDMLGDTLEQIAGEKAGIIKHGVPVIIGQYQDETLPVFVKKAREEKSRIFLDHDFGDTTSERKRLTNKELNRSAVSMLAHVLKEYGWQISDQHVHQGFDQLEALTGLKGRYQVLDREPLTIADVGHNVDGLRGLFSQVKATLEERGAELHLVYGTVKDKALSPIFELFPSKAHIYWTQSSVPRALKVEELAIQGVVNGIEGVCHKDVNEAIKEARSKAKPTDVILITGSTFVVAEIDGL